MSTLRLYDLAPSPNNVKVRLALGLKGIDYERVPVDPQNRAPIVEATGQPLTPAMVHGTVRLFDSAAILRYLDANFAGPRLFSDDRDTMREIEGWELFARTQVQPCIGRVFGQFFAPAVDEAECAAASQALNAATERVEERLSRGPYLVGDAPTAADLSIAPFVHYGVLDPERHDPSTVAGFFARHLELGPGRELTRAWCERVMAHDR